MASGLEDMIITIKTLSFYGHYKDLREYLGKSSEILVENNQHLDNVLNALNIKQHSLGYLFVLVAKFNSEASIYCSFSPDSRFALARRFILDCDEEQIRLAPNTFAELCHLLANYLSNIKQPTIGIFVLKTAIAKLRVRNTQLTSIHADLCQLCLMAKFYEPVLEILDTDITEVCQEMFCNPNELQYFLLYYYCGGLIYLILKNLHRALYFFEVALTTPVHSVSRHMLDSYKKYILLSLILHGEVDTKPEFASEVVNLYVKPLSKAYTDLAKAFASSNRDKFNDVLNKHKSAFTKDYNLSLAKRVSSVLYKKNIKRLTKVYSTLSLSDVASRVGLPGPLYAERYIEDMIEKQQIYATIIPKNKMVVFRDKPDKTEDPEVLKKIEAQKAIVMKLKKEILAVAKDIQVNPIYKVQD